MTAALRAEGLSVRYGGVHALRGVDVSVEPGQLVGIIGPNGAGKTTFIDAVSGFAPSEGRVVLDGDDISLLRPHERVRRGLARTFQSSELFGDLSVRQNLGVAATRLSARDAVKAIITGRAESPRAVDGALGLLGIEGLADAMPDELSEGQRKLVSAARRSPPSTG